MKFSGHFAEVETVPCPLCSGTEFTVLAEDDRYRMGVRTAACVGCGFLMTNPMPTAAELENFYRHHYRKFYQKHIAPSAEEIHRLGMDERAEYTVEILRANGLLAENSRVLDVGCGYGVVLKAIRKRCRNAVLVGVEPGAAAAAFARDYAQCHVVQHLDEIDVRDGRFDLVIVNHVLEHARDPVAFLRSVIDVVSPRGAVYIDVPDADRYGSLADLHIAHLCHFTKRTLEMAVRAAGFSAAKIEQHLPPHHPPSVRCVARTTEVRPLPAAARKGTTAPRDEAAARIRAIGRSAWKYHLLNSPIVRSLVRPFVLPLRFIKTRSAVPHRSSTISPSGAPRGRR